MKLNHIYNSYAVYINETEGTYKVDGFNEVFSTLKEANNFIKEQKIRSFMHDEAVGMLYRLGFYRVAFIVQYDEMVIKEKWSNDSAEITFSYDNGMMNVNGNLDASDMMKIIKKVYSNPDNMKTEQTIIRNVVNGTLKSFVSQNKTVNKSNFEKVGSAVVKGIFSELSSKG